MCKELQTSDRSGPAQRPPMATIMATSPIKVPSRKHGVQYLINQSQSRIKFYNLLLGVKLLANHQEKLIDPVIVMSRWRIIGNLSVLSRRADASTGRHVPVSVTSVIQSLSQSFDSSLANNLIDLPEFVEEIGREFNVPPQTETLAT